MKRLQTAIAIISVLIVAVAVVLTAKYCNQAEDVTTTTETTTKSTETSTTEPITEVLTETETTTTTTTEKAVETKYTPSPHLTEDGYVTPEFFRKHGVIYGNGYKYTWYSEKVLSGGALHIPDRHSDGYYVRDADEYIVLASPDLQKIPKGTIIETPFGTGKVYDHNENGDSIDVYVSW